MTTEEKAKAYDEALERAKAHINSKGIGDTVDLCKHLFSELRESEDETTRKELLDFVKSFCADHGRRFPQVFRWISYLENQKENPWSEEDEAIVKTMCKEGDLKPSERAWLMNLKNRISKDSLHISEMCKENVDSFADISEDEKIRKEISTLYSDIDACITELLKARIDKDSEAEGKALFKMEGLMVGTLQDLSCIEDYLEKQKEQKPISAEEVLVRAGLKPYKDGNQWCILAGDNIQEGICGFGNTIDEALYQFLMEVLEKQKEEEGYEAIPIESTLEYKLGFKAGKESEKQKEQKPTPNWMPKFLDELRSKKNHFGWDEHRDFEGHILAIINWIAPDYFDKKEQKPAPISCCHENGTEWSEEDERIKEWCISHFKECSYVSKDNLEFKQYLNNKIIPWFKSLCPQSKQMISKDTEVLMAKLVNLLKSYGIGEETATTLANRISDTYGTQRYMDGLCDGGKPYWKPSKEQMKWLKDVIKTVPMTCRQQVPLESLYNDLLKQM